ncbi:MAG: hypothetical protein WC324_04720 [Candidatus Omnitrophota bacterium]|jgi:hypothetical protein
MTREEFNDMMFHFGTSNKELAQQVKEHGKILTGRETEAKDRVSSGLGRCLKC